MAKSENQEGAAPKQEAQKPEVRWLPIDDSLDEFGRWLLEERGNPNRAKEWDEWDAAEAAEAAMDAAVKKSAMTKSKKDKEAVAVAVAGNLRERLKAAEAAAEKMAQRAKEAKADYTEKEAVRKVWEDRKQAARDVAYKASCAAFWANLVAEHEAREADPETQVFHEALSKATREVIKKHLEGTGWAMVPNTQELHETKEAWGAFLETEEGRKWKEAFEAETEAEEEKAREWEEAFAVGIATWETQQEAKTAEEAVNMARAEEEKVRQLDETTSLKAREAGEALSKMQQAEQDSERAIATVAELKAIIQTAETSAPDTLAEAFGISETPGPNDPNDPRKWPHRERAVLLALVNGGATESKPMNYSELATNNRSESTVKRAIVGYKGSPGLKDRRAIETREGYNGGSWPTPYGINAAEILNTK